MNGSTPITLAVNAAATLKPSIEALSSSSSSTSSSSVSSLRLLDLVLPALLLLLSFILRILYTDARPKRLGAHLYRAKTAHARYLPSPAGHRFSYPVLFLGLDLDELEHPQRRLDQGRWFRYDSKGWSCMAIRPRVYLGPPNTGGSLLEHAQSTVNDHTPIKTKLLCHLQQRGIPGDLVDKVYTVTMPAFMGMQDINPLTIHYVYSVPNSEEKSRPERQLNVVVLEVSNTFGEKHLYILRCGVDEDDRVSSGFDHQWTFPRAFHVSPFNDRTGHYRVSLSDPLAGSNSPSTAPSSSSFLASHAHLNLKIVFLTPSFEKKFFADLSGPGEPLSPSSILSALLKWPLTLLLTTPRILYQAMLLHYRHRLDVFPRPDPFVPSSTGKDGDATLVNPVEKGALPANVQWQEETAFETRCQGKVLAFLDRRIAEMNDLGKRSVRVIIRPGDPTRLIMTVPNNLESSVSGDDIDTVVINCVSYQFWTDLYTSPSIHLALELGSQTEQRWSTDNNDLFLEVFRPLSTPALKPSRTTSWIRSLRRKQMNWSRSFSPSYTTAHDSAVGVHPLDDPTSNTDLQALFLHFFFLRLGYWLFVIFRARFVRGKEPWEEWARWERRFAEGAGRKEVEVREQYMGGVGSVLRI